MARKNVLSGLMDQSTPTATEPPPRPTRGAIGAVSRSIADLKSRAVVELDPLLIDAGGLADRIESDEASDETLRASIAEYGQQVPVLVRPNPDTEGRFQIVYGRRRVLAMRDLGQPVKALIRDLDDRELVLAQGQENSARRDLSFIEKVSFARQLEQHGYDRKVIGDALSIDKTLVSRMLAVAERVPADLVAVIGAAPAVGRDRWLALAEMLVTTGADLDDLAPMIALNAASPRSDDRFQAAWDYLAGLLKRGKAPPAAPQPIRAADGLTLGQVKRDGTFCTLKLRRATTAGFEDWLLAALPALYADWQKTSADPKP